MRRRHWQRLLARQVAFATWHLVPLHGSTPNWWLFPQPLSIEVKQSIRIERRPAAGAGGV